MWSDSLDCSELQCHPCTMLPLASGSQPLWKQNAWGARWECQNDSICQLETTNVTSVSCWNITQCQMMALFHVSAPWSSYRLRSFFGEKNILPPSSWSKNWLMWIVTWNKEETVQVHQLDWGSLANHSYRSQEKGMGLTETVSIKWSRTALFQGPNSRKCANNMVSDCCQPAFRVISTGAISVTVKMKECAPPKCQNIQPQYGTGTRKVTTIWTTPAMKSWTVISLKVLQQPVT